MLWVPRLGTNHAIATSGQPHGLGAWKPPISAIADIGRKRIYEVEAVGAVDSDDVASYSCQGLRGRGISAGEGDGPESAAATGFWAEERVIGGSEERLAMSVGCLAMLLAAHRSWSCQPD